MDEELEKFCVWDWNLSWNSDHPRLSPCFRHLVLSLVPCLALWLMTTLKTALTRWWKPEFGKSRGPLPWTLIAICKQVLTCLLIASTTTEGCCLFYAQWKNARVEYVSVFTRMATYVLALYLQIRQRRDGHLTSLKLAAFWSLLACGQFLASPIYDLIVDDITAETDSTMFVVRTISVSLVMAQAILSHFTDPQYDLLFCDSKTDEFLMDNQAPIPRLLFSWLSRIMSYGYKNSISLEDLDVLPPDLKAAYVGRRFLESWQREENLAKNMQKTKTCSRAPSLCLSLIRPIWPLILASITLEIFFDVISFIPPIVLDWLISFMDSDEPSWHGYVYAVLLFGTAALSNMLMAHNLHYLILASITPRSGLCAAIYQKMFRLSLDSRRGYSLGELCNLVTVDAQRVCELIWSVNLLWSNPIRISIAIALLWQYLGVASLAGVCVLVALAPITTLVAVHIHRLQKMQMERKDSRLRTMNDVLNGIKVLKLFGWEPPFMERVTEVRKLETKALKKLAFLNGVIVFLWIIAPFLVALCSFVTFELIDENNVLDPSIAFVSLTLFAKLRAAMSSMPQLITETVQARISIRRLIDFLLCKEMDEDSNKREQPSAGNAIELDAASFSWSGTGDPFLCDLSLRVNRGTLVGVVGHVGTGKSALLEAMLGEMTRTAGDIRLDKGARLAYVPQRAWIQNTTLRQNILFVNPMDRRRYDSILKRCCLKPDLKTLPGGDLVEIGEKGVNLSGGQKQRVNLARAVYHDADIYLMDDPLSAVDANVSKSLFDDVIGPTGLLGHKTRILVTHNLSILPRCDTIVMMSGGRITESGSYDELLKQNGELARLVNEFKLSQKEEDLEKSETIPSPNPESLSTQELKDQMRRIGNRLSRSLSRTISSEKDPGEVTQRDSRYIENERMEIGRVRAGVYRTYFRSSGYVITFFICLGFAAYQSFEVGSNVWLSAWSSDPVLPDGSQNIPLRNFRMEIYGLLGFAQGSCILLGAFLLALASTRASIYLHRSMLWSIMRSPLIFFDTTPLGRILNRFGKDIQIVDVAIPAAFNSIVTILTSGIGTLLVICVTHPLFLLIMVPIATVYLIVQFFYMATSRQIRRLQSVTLSPVLSFFSESIQGASVIRAFGTQCSFIKRQNRLIDRNCTVFVNNTFVNRWLSIRLQLLGAAIVLIVAVLSVLQRRVYTAAIVGLTLSYALNVTEILAQMVRMLTQLETRMVSVERVEEYSKLEEEASWTTDRCGVSTSDWPRQGSIVFKEYEMRYRPDLRPVLRGINLEIPGGQKVGIVGRTGAGKSSLAQALFRVVEPSDGALFVDQLDISLLGLHDLRSRITVIPQDPVLFGGELRLNLDPCGTHSDNEILSALQLARMPVPAGGLGAVLEEGGENLSVGQRQQLCLARALLKRSRILVLDEATAAVDPETDRLIQETIRTEFKGCTVLTVAHRLHTVLDYDRILVLDNGKIVEDGPPDFLLQKHNSMLKELAHATGLL